MKFVFAFCEGPHDVALLYRVLKTEAFESYNRKLGEYPAPLNQFLIREAKHLTISEVNLQSVKSRLLPVEIMRYGGETLLLLYALGGDQRQLERQRILQHIMDTYGPIDPDALLPGEGHEAAAIYFFDADQVGKDARYVAINTELTNVFGEQSPSLSLSSPVGSVNGINLGGFIFADLEQDYGKLEDLLVPMMEHGNEDISASARQLIDAHYSKDRCLKLKITILEKGKVSEKRGKSKRDRLKFDRKKSLIGIAGQLQQSGKGNNPIIRDTDYLTLTKIRNHPSCQELVRFIRRLL